MPHSYPQVSLEQVIKANPALILAGSQDADALRHWQQWPMVNAVRHQRLQLINSDELHRFTQEHSMRWSRYVKQSRPACKLAILPDS